MCLHPALWPVKHTTQCNVTRLLYLYVLVLRDLLLNSGLTYVDTPTIAGLPLSADGEPLSLNCFTLCPRDWSKWFRYICEYLHVCLISALYWIQIYMYKIWLETEEERGFYWKTSKTKTKKHLTVFITGSPTYQLMKLLLPAEWFPISITETFRRGARIFFPSTLLMNSMLHDGVNKHYW